MSKIVSRSESISGIVELDTNLEDVKDNKFELTDYYGNKTIHRGIIRSIHIDSKYKTFTISFDLIENDGDELSEKHYAALMICNDLNERGFDCLVNEDTDEVIVHNSNVRTIEEALLIEAGFEKCQYEIKETDACIIIEPII